MSAPLFYTGARVLGAYGLMASWRRRVDGRWEPNVCITAAASSDAGVHAPAQSVDINSRAGLLALRDVIDEALRQDEPLSDGSAA